MTRRDSRDIEVTSFLERPEQQNAQVSFRCNRSDPTLELSEQQSNALAEERCSSGRRLRASLDLDLSPFQRNALIQVVPQKRVIVYPRLALSLFVSLTRLVSLFVSLSVSLSLSLSLSLSFFSFFLFFHSLSIPHQRHEEVDPPHADGKLPINLALWESFPTKNTTHQEFALAPFRIIRVLLRLQVQVCSMGMTFTSCGTKTSMN